MIPAQANQSPNVFSDHTDGAGNAQQGLAGNDSILLDSNNHCPESN